jgi:CHAT domain-containing protein
MFALVLNKSKDVNYIPIGNVNDIKDKLTLEPADLYHNTEFTQFIWGPIEKAIGENSIIYYLPIGLFNQIAIGSMCLDKKTDTYLCDAKSLRLLSNPADLTEDRNMNLSSNPKLISLWGGIDYGGSSNNLSTSRTKRTAIKRGENLSNLIYAYQEVNDIASILNNKKWRNILFTKTDATESNFKKRAGKKDYIIHVSTHGFFNENANLNNSMYESGLFFAGANKYWSNDSLQLELGQEDGILRAAEIATLDLTGCELVVLSACETGLGYSNSSEGVYGLQRSFKLAGAKYVLMSLWDVDDRATTLLMTEFYKNLTEGKNLEESLEESKKTVKRLYPSPEDWGAFVLLH